MATVNHAIVNTPDQGNFRIHRWPSLGGSDVGQALELNPVYSDKTVQVVGTFGSATVVIQGSLDGSTYATLTDPQGNALSFTSAGLEMVSEVTRYIRPSVSGGSGSAIDVYLLAKKVQ